MDTFDVGRLCRSRLIGRGYASCNMLQSNQKADSWQSISSALLLPLLPAYPNQSLDMRPVTKIKIFGFRLAAVVLAGYWAMIFIGTHQPSILDPTPQLINDKVKHFGAFFILGGMLCYVTNSSRWLRRFGTIGAVGMAYGAIDELTQHLVPRRSPDVLDFVADSAGLWTAILIYAAAKWAYEHSRRPPLPT